MSGSHVGQYLTCLFCEEIFGSHARTLHTSGNDGFDATFGNNQLTSDVRTKTRCLCDYTTLLPLWRLLKGSYILCTWTRQVHMVETSSRCGKMSLIACTVRFPTSTINLSSWCLSLMVCQFRQCIRLQLSIEMCLLLWWLLSRHSAQFKILSFISLRVPHVQYEMEADFSFFTRKLGSHEIKSSLIIYSIIEKTLSTDSS